MKEAQEAAEKLLEADPGLAEPENRVVMGRVKRLFAEDGDIFN